MCASSWSLSKITLIGLTSHSVELGQHLLGEIKQQYNGLKWQILLVKISRIV